MPKQPFESWPRPDESPALAGPDYVALVIEWDEPQEAGAPDDTGEVTHRVIRSSGTIKKALAVAVSLGAFLLATWGIHRLRHA